MVPSVFERTREIGMLRAVAEIAREACVSETTVKTHVTRSLMKLCLRDRVQPSCSHTSSGSPNQGHRQPLRSLYTSNEGLPIQGS